jgi:hypothetical protein
MTTVITFAKNYQRFNRIILSAFVELDTASNVKINHINLHFVIKYKFGKKSQTDKKIIKIGF